MTATWQFAGKSSIPVLVLLLALLSSVAAAAEVENLSQFRKSQLHMGVEFEIVLYAATADQADTAIAKAFARVAALDKVMSDYDPASELTQFSDSSTVPPGADTTAPPLTARPIRFSDDLLHVLAYSQQLSAQTEGAFDVTIGPLSKLWRRARRQSELPAAERLAEARASVGYAFLKLDPERRTGQLLRPNMRLDLGGIAKGLAADEALEEIKRAGISRALVRASGDIAVGDAPPGESGWKIGIASLNPDDPPQRFVRLANRAISTSGDARQHLVVDGRRYSHIIDPRTGVGISGRSSVSVVAPQGMVADALGTAISVLGPEKGLDLVARINDVARTKDALLLMVVESDGEVREVQSPGFAAILEPQP
jgi:thiamine biosynthesis lipoprotein